MQTDSGSRTSLIGRALKGAVAGAAGTIAMDLYWYAEYRRNGGTENFIDWETSAGLENWEDAPAPAKMGKLIAEKALGAELDAKQWARPLNNLMHWGYGLFWGSAYGVLRGDEARSRLANGYALGTFIFASDYVVLPAAGIYKPIWDYDFETQFKDWLAHFIFGLGTVTIFGVRQDEPAGQG